MKIVLKPRDGTTFTPGDLRDQLARWVQPNSEGILTARCTLGGKIREVTLELDGTVEPETGGTGA